VKLIRPQSAASQLYSQWKNLALSSDQHVLAVYGQSTSWTLGYNMFADVWLGTNLVDSSVSVNTCWSLVVPDKFSDIQRSQQFHRQHHDKFNVQQLWHAC
jgi:hypothetical protein